MPREETRQETIGLVFMCANLVFWKMSLKYITKGSFNKNLKKKGDVESTSNCI